MASPLAPTRALLFDLGGVVLDIDFSRAIAAWAPHSRLPPAQLRAAFAADEPFQRHETGRLDNEAYFAHLRQLLALDCALDQVQAGFNAILAGEIEETVQMLDAVRGSVPCYAISNTNAAHIAEIERSFPRLLPRFTQVFASHRIGHRKPSPAAFTHVLQEIGLPAAEVLLFDDLQPNIDAARALGLQAVRVTSPADVRGALVRRGMLSARGPAAPPTN